MRTKGAALALVVSMLGLSLGSGSAEAAGPGEIVKQVTYNGQTVTVRMHPVTLRAPGFQVYVQQPDGSFQTYPAPPERAYLGSVDGVPGAVSSGIINSDNTVEGQVVFDRGAVWQFKESTVYATRGLTPPASYSWPSATDPALNVTVAPGQAGTTTYRWDLGYDLDNAWFNAAPVSGDVARALDIVELSTVSLYDVYATNALLRPAVGRVVVRAAAGQDPYAGGATLGKVQTEWTSGGQAGHGMDDVALLDRDYGGGVAFVGAAGTTNGVSVNGGAGASRAILRHELGHTWGARDNHTNGPEGATIESGNQYERFDGTELSAIFRYRDYRQAASSPFTVVPTLTEPVPPYAGLDLVDGMVGKVTFKLRPTRNDHDANLDALSLHSAKPHSRFGGPVSIEKDALTYTPPAVTVPTVDSVEYVVRDSTGRTATGVVLFRIAPYVSPGPASGWPAQSGVYPPVTYDLVNTQSGLPAGVKKNKKPGKVVQRGGPSAKTKIKLVKKGGTYQIRSRFSKACWTAVTKKRVLAAKCAKGAKGGKVQRWRAVVHPAGGTALVNRKTGRCLAPSKASMFAGARLVQRPCGLSQAQSWRLTTPPLSAWSEVAVSGSHSLTQVSSGLRLGVPDGASGSGDLVLRQPSGATTQFTFAASPSGGYEIRNAQSNRCVDVYSSSTQVGAKVGTWSCAGSANQRWRVLATPAGGVALRSVSSGLCLTGSATGVVQVACGLEPAVRWSLS